MKYLTIFKQWLFFAGKNDMIEIQTSTGLLRAAPAEDGQSETYYGENCGI